MTSSHKTVIKEPHGLTTRELDTDSKMFLYVFEFRTVPGRHYTKNETPEGQNSQRARISRSDLTVASNCVNIFSHIFIITNDTFN